MHIPPEHLLPQDMIDIHDHGQSPPKVLRMHVSDAKHAMNVEPERYRLPGHAVAKPEPEQTGADGPAWYPPSEEKPVE